MGGLASPNDRGDQTEERQRRVSPFHHTTPCNTTAMLPFTGKVKTPTNTTSKQNNRAAQRVPVHGTRACAFAHQPIPGNARQVAQASNNAATKRPQQRARNIYKFLRKVRILRSSLYTLARLLRKRVEKPREQGVAEKTTNNKRQETEEFVTRATQRTPGDQWQRPPCVYGPIAPAPCDSCEGPCDRLEMSVWELEALTWFAYDREEVANSPLDVLRLVLRTPFLRPACPSTRSGALWSGFTVREDHTGGTMRNRESDAAARNLSRRYPSSTSSNSF